tara:strand:+ start:164389 stop:165588 length:1200 start_codon:yes stop_codon:yes gene_type:complete
MSHLEPLSRPIFGIVAGEASGDLLGQSLIKHLKNIYPHARFVGVGGEKMISEGLESLDSIETLSVMGLIEPLKKLPQIFRLRNKLVKFFKANRPLCFIGIDAPDFNLRIEKTFKNMGIKTAHLVSPTLWAWREGRIHGIKKSTDLMLLIFPFEKEFYDKHNVAAAYIGHPLADEIPMFSDKAQARKALGLSLKTQYITLMPGSRDAELRYLGEPFFEAAEWLRKKYPKIRFIVACLNEKRKQQLIKHLNNQFNLDDFHFVVGQATLAMQASDVILLASGTAALQAALIKRPIVVAYKMSHFTFQIAKRVVKVKSISLPNIIAGRKVITELVQNDATPKNMCQAIELYLNTQDESEALIDEFTRQHKLLKCEAGEKAAKAIQKFVEKRVKDNVHSSAVQK